MCENHAMRIVEAARRAADAQYDLEEFVFEGRHLEEARRILVAMRYERALALFDEAVARGSGREFYPLMGLEER